MKVAYFWMRNVLYLSGLILTCSFILISSWVSAKSAEMDADWIDGYKNRVRLFSAEVKEEASRKIFAFLEIEMSKGWKTYWKNPGTAGGIAPEFNFKNSKNIGKIDILYPVPELIRDSAGDTIGYKEHVIFPIEIKPNSNLDPVELNLNANYGICEKLCVPVDVNLSLKIPSNFSEPASEDALSALSAIPRQKGALLTGDPHDLSVKQMLSDISPRIILSAYFPGEAERANIFLDVEGGKYIPIPVQTKIEDKVISFDLNLSDPQILESLRGSKVNVTMKGENGHSEDSFIIN